MDPAAKKFCCCYPKKGAIIVGILTVFFAVSSLSADVYGSKKDGLLPAGGLAAKVIFNLLCLAGAGLLFYGVHKENEKLLIPHLVLQGLSILVYLIIIILCVIALTPYGQKQLEHRLDKANVLKVMSGSLPFGEADREAMSETGNTLNNVVSVEINIVLGFFIVVSLVNVIFDSIGLAIVRRCYKYIRDKKSGGNYGLVTQPAVA